VREALNAQGNDRIITRRDLIATGVVVVGPGNTLQPTDPTELAKVKYDTPPAPTGLATSGAIANIILTWDAPNYPGHSYTEVYVADTNTFTSRVKLADVPGSTYSHSVGASTTKYYWIRFVNVAEVPGPYNSTTGVSGTTGDDPDYLISVLSDAYGVTGDGLFFQINSPTVINGVTIPAGTYIKQAVIADATIARAKIQDLAVDNAKIADLSAVKITAITLAERLLRNLAALDLELLQKLLVLLLSDLRFGAKIPELQLFMVLILVHLALWLFKGTQALRAMVYMDSPLAVSLFED
jgi:predicted phage tail protein